MEDAMTATVVAVMTDVVVATPTVATTATTVVTVAETARADALLVMLPHQPPMASLPLVGRPVSHTEVDTMMINTPAATER
jgi:hypothetical protein